MSASAGQRRLLVKLAAGAVVVMTVPVVCEGQPAVAVETHDCETPCPAAVLALSGMGVWLSAVTAKAFVSARGCARANGIARAQPSHGRCGSRGAVAFRRGMREQQRRASAARFAARIACEQGRWALLASAPATLLIGTRPLNSQDCRAPARRRRA